MDSQLISVSEPLSYPSIRTVIRYFPLETRLKADRSIPFLQTINRKMPISFKKIGLSYENGIYWVQFDDFLWCFSREIGGIWVRNQVARLLVFYLGRQGTQVQELHYQNFPMSADLLKFVRISNLKMDFLKPGDMESGVKVFRKKSIKLVEIDINTDRTAWSDGITKIHTNHLKITKFGTSRANFFVNLKNERLEIRDHYLTAQKFLNVFRKFQKGKHAIGSFYEARIATDDARSIWNEVRRGVEAEMKGGHFLASRIPNSNKEIFATKLLVVPENPKGSLEYQFRVEVVKEGDGVKESHNLEYNSFYQFLQEMSLQLKHSLRKFPKIFLFNWFLIIGSLISSLALLQYSEKPLLAKLLYDLCLFTFSSFFIVLFSAFTCTRVPAKDSIFLMIFENFFLSLLGFFAFCASWGYSILAFFNVSQKVIE